MAVAVIGAGVAGVACVWALCRRGIEVIAFDDRAGSSALSSGALDARPVGTVAPISAELMAFAQGFEAWSLTTDERWIATAAGVIREVRGIDTGLLDLAPLAGGRIGVADLGVPAFDAETLARALSAASWAVATRTRFVRVELDLVAAEAPSLADFDLARRFEADPPRSELVRALAGVKDVDGWLVGPWLGTSPHAVASLRASLPIPIGEITSSVGGPAGARFEAARDRLLSALGTLRVARRVISVQPRRPGWEITASGPNGALEQLVADEVVLAIGGVAGGGITVGAGGALLDRARFGTSVGLEVDFELDGRNIDRVSSLHGIDVQALGVSALERIGIAHTGGRVRGCDGIYLAGDVVPGAARTLLGAAQSGIDAAALVGTARSPA
ncbi:MAG TPA: hypothetical protein VKZ49_08265 [Polyangiaceae bacterium]|nr:hypothetical protein [Polyangiaceae bacterium]